MVGLLEATLELSVPQSVMIRQTQTNMAERAWRLSIRVKITMLWQVVRWHGAVTTLDTGREGKPTSGIVEHLPRWKKKTLFQVNLAEPSQLVAGMITFSWAKHTRRLNLNVTNSVALRLIRATRAKTFAMVMTRAKPTNATSEETQSAVVSTVT